MVGRIVRLCLDRGCGLSKLSLAEYREMCDRIGADVFHAIAVEGSLAARDIPGGTAPVQVRAAIGSARLRLQQDHARLP